VKKLLFFLALSLLLVVGWLLNRQGPEYEINITAW